MYIPEFWVGFAAGSVAMLVVLVVAAVVSDRMKGDKDA